MSQKLYDAVKSGQIRIDDLNEAGKAALRSFTSAKVASEGGGDIGFDPEVSDPSLQYRAQNPIEVPQEAEVYSPEGGYVAPASGADPLWEKGDAAKVAFQALKVPYNLGFRGGPETDVFTEPTQEPAFTQQDMQQYQESMAPQSPLGKVAGWGAEQAGLLPFYATAELAAGAPLAAGASKGLSGASKLFPKLAPAIEKATPYAQTFASGFGLGAPVGMMESYGAGESLPDVAKSGLESGLTFGGFNLGIKGIGSLIKKGLAPKVQTSPLPEVPWKPIETPLPKAELPTMPTIEPKVSAEVKGIPTIEALKADMADAVPLRGRNSLLGEGSISAAKGSTPGKIEPTGNPNEYTQSFVSAAAQSPAVDRNVKDILWWDLQPGESGTYGRRTHKMISEQADGFITSNPDAAYRHATSVETIANEPDLSVAIGIKLAEHHQKTNPTLADEILNEIGDQLTKHGQAISASRLLVRMTPQGMINNIEKNIVKLNKEGLEQYGKKWKDIELTSAEREAISKLKIGDKAGYEALNEQIQARIGNELPASAMEKVNAWRHIAMLLNPKTQIRNIGGNLIMMGMRRTAKTVSAVLQKVAVKAEDRTQVFSVKKEFKDSATAYFDANKRELLGGPNKYQENIKLNMPNKRVFQSNALDKTRKFTYKLLEMGDTPFFKNAYVDRLASFAQARGIKDFSKLPKEAFETALKEAEQATYKDASEVATFLNKLKNPGAKANAIQKGAAFGLEAATPFVKTPINIIKRGIQYSPAGIINTIGKWKSAEGIDELAKGLTGTGILGLGYLLAKHGILTGKASEDADLKAYNANAGQSPFSILGKYTYDWAQPFAVPLSVGVEIYNALKENPLEQQQMDSVLATNDTSRLQQIAVSVSGSIIDSLSASGDTVFNMSIMKGIKNLLGNPQGATAGLAQLPQQYASQFIPTLSSQIAGQVDPTVRQSYEKGNLAGSMKNALLSKIPFASKTLPAKQSPYGEDIKRIENPALRAFGQFLSPGIIATDQNVKPGIDKELRRLNAEGLKNQFPTITPNYIDKTQKHPRINLTPEEATQYQKRTGKLTEEAFNKIINSSKYQNATANKEKNKSADEVKADMLAKAIADAKALAKAEIVKAKGYK